MASAGVVRRIHGRMYGLLQRHAPRYVFLSYPKSGRTWVRFMIDCYVTQRYGRTVKRVFDIEQDPVLSRKHRITYTHFVVGRPYYDVGCFKERATLVPSSHAVLLTRNIYATLASAYCHARYRTKQFTGSPIQYLRDPRRGALKLIMFYNLWLELRAEFLSSAVFSYEALTRDTKGVFRRILASLGIGADDDGLLDRVVTQASFKRLQELSLSEDYRDTPLAPGDVHDQRSWKVREGKAGGFREMFSPDDIAYIARLIDELLIDKTLVDVSASGT